MTAAALAAVVALTPNPSHFGQLVTATVSGGPPPSFVPFVVRSHQGATYVLQCLDPACVPGPAAVRIRLGSATAIITPRTTAAQVTHPLKSFRRETALAPPSYRVRPAVLHGLLLALAALLTALAIAIAYPALRRLVPEAVDERTPLQRALDLARASITRGGEDRRRALDVLGRALAEDGRARNALGLAWSRPPPEPGQITELLEQVERTERPT